MLLGLISDTHGQAAPTRKAVRMLQSLEAEVLLHCGDLGDASIVPLLAPWTTHYVFGNCDYERQPLRDAIAAAGHVCHEELGQIELAGVRIALLHSHDRPAMRRTLQSGEFDLLCYGHTHTAAIDRHGTTLAVNPGAVVRANPPSVAIVELPSLRATIVPF